MILFAQNRLGCLYTPHSMYYIRGLCGGRHFLTVGSCDLCTAEKGVGLVRRMHSWRIKHQYNKKALKRV